MRITGGQARGRVINGPTGLEARPTASKIRQAFFNILYRRVPDSRFLDLFAGTGLIGLEALSRGAASLVAVEENRRLARSIEANLVRLGFEGEVICRDVRKVLSVLEPAGFDLIFADPPYLSDRLGLSVLISVDKHRLLSEGGIVAIEHARSARLPEQVGELSLFDHRHYGQTAVSFYSWSAGGAGLIESR